MWIEDKELVDRNNHIAETLEQVIQMSAQQVGEGPVYRLEPVMARHRVNHEPIRALSRRFNNSTAVQYRDRMMVEGVQFRYELAMGHRSLGLAAQYAALQPHIDQMRPPVVTFSRWSDQPCLATTRPGSPPSELVDSSGSIFSIKNFIVLNKFGQAFRAEQITRISGPSPAEIANYASRQWYDHLPRTSSLLDPTDSREVPTERDDYYDIADFLIGLTSGRILQSQLAEKIQGLT